MAAPSDQAAGSNDTPATSPGHPAASHGEVYTGNPAPLPPAIDGQLPFNFSRPEPSFDPNDNSAVTNFFKYQDNARHVLDPRGERAPTIEEQVTNQIEELQRQRGGQDVSDEERKAIEQTLRRNSGWQESYKAEVAGAQAVPIAAFNRLAHDYDQLQLATARHRASYEADAIRDMKELEEQLMDQTTHEEESLTETETETEPLDPDSNEFRHSLLRLTNAVATKDEEISRLKKQIDDADMADAEAEPSEAQSNSSSEKDASEVKRLQQALDLLTGENEKLESTLKKQVQQATSRDVEMATSQANTDKEMADLKQTIDSMRTQMDDQAALLKTRNEDNAKLAQEREQLREQVDGLSIKSRDAEGQRDMCQESISNLEKQVEQINLSDKNGQEKISDLERELSEVRKSEEANKDKISMLSVEVRGLAESHEDIVSKNKELQQERDIARSEGRQSGEAEIKQLKEQLQTAGSEAKAHRAEAEGMQIRLSKAESSAQDNEDKAKGLEREKTETAQVNQTQLDSLQEQVSTAQMSAKNDHERISRMEKNQVEHQATISSLQEQLAASDGSLQQGNEKIADLQGQLVRYIESEVEIQSRVESLERDLSTATQSQDEAERRVQELQNELQSSGTASQAAGKTGIFGVEPEPEVLGLAESHAEIRRLRSENTRVETQLAANRERYLAERQRQPDDQRASDSWAEVSRLRQENQDLQRRIAEFVELGRLLGQ
ncbi:hypothetical protein PG999_004711 [Apiospora kogelbergensis]|uniref:Chromosome segregation ATPase n=1 Tax=Apiospora kogelbergensis TaxID=1337665 RepID=A0AAW0R023_9PEZI